MTFHFRILTLASIVASTLLYAQIDPLQEAIELDTVIVTASPFAVNKEDLVVPASQLTDDALERAAQSSLGATLDGQPGVHSTYFGPGAGRPVIRGFDGDRVRILNQGTDSFDASFTSPDHGVSIEPLFADRIEVVRGPASLLYGNAAIGGVVNVIGKELPRFRASAPFQGEFQTSYGSVADENKVGLSVQGGSGNFSWSAGYLDRSAKDHEIPGFAESTFQMEAEEVEHHDDEHEDEHGEEGEEHEEEVFGVLENSFVDTRSGYIGAAWFGDKGSIGFSYSRFGTDYGVPGHAHEEEHDDEEEGEENEEEEHGEEESVVIDLDQSRFSLRGELLDPNDFLESIELQFGYGEYEHVELEGEAIGTRFQRDGYELRTTGVHRAFGDLTGAIGLHVKDESFSALGDEAFIPSNDTASYGLFAVERLNREWGAWEFGGRIESVSVDPEGGELAKRSFTTVNASAGFFRRVGKGATVSSNFTYAERAPNASELFAFGPHAGTQAFEIGGVALGKESSLNLDLAFRKSIGFVTGEFTVFHSGFGDYVYLQFLDENVVLDTFGDLDVEGLNVFRATAADARFYGFELDLRFHIIDEADRQMHFDLLIDQTRAVNDSFDSNLPRIPTRRFGGRYEVEQGAWLFGVEGRFHEAASHLAPNELPSNSYFLWGADARYRIQATDTATVDLFVIGRNLGDEEARPHSSFLKDLAPMPGRNIEMGVRTRF